MSLWTLSCRGARTGTLVPSWFEEPTCTRRGTAPRRSAMKTPSTQTTRPPTGCITSECRHRLAACTSQSPTLVNWCLNLLLVLAQVFGICVGGDWTQSQGKYYGCDSQWGHSEVHPGKVSFSACPQPTYTFTIRLTIGLILPTCVHLSKWNAVFVCAIIGLFCILYITLLLNGFSKCWTADLHYVSGHWVWGCFLSPPGWMRWAFRPPRTRFTLDSCLECATRSASHSVCRADQHWY